MQWAGAQAYKYKTITIEKRKQNDLPFPSSACCSPSDMHKSKVWTVRAPLIIEAEAVQILTSIKTFGSVIPVLTPRPATPKEPDNMTNTALKTRNDCFALT